MRVTFSRNIRTMSGKCNNGEMVFQSKKNNTVCIARNYVYPHLNANHTLSGNKMKAAASLWSEVPNGFKEDLKRYANAYNSQLLPRKKLRISAYNVFIMAIGWHNAPINTLDSVKTLLGNTVSEWISIGALKKVTVTVPFTAILVS
ncbi:MAG: hypothetical protein FWG98_08395 [Candidatus Cloacimonetes bacterium]|nr:hypothetical protein [Candidatus Cloacimonadota bacterium]